MKYKKHKQYRLYGYDYSQSGSYFITIVTKNRGHFFGEIENGHMIFSPIGQFIVDNFIIINEKIDYLTIDEWSVLPNHIHLIITIKQDKHTYTTVEGLRPLVEKSISSFVNHLKGSVKRWCNENGLTDFAWQARFHDRIIRDADEYYRIANYIQMNVQNWAEDVENIK